MAFAVRCLPCGAASGVAGRGSVRRRLAKGEGEILCRIGIPSATAVRCAGLWCVGLWMCEAIGDRIDRPRPLVCRPLPAECSLQRRKDRPGNDAYTQGDAGARERAHQVVLGEPHVVELLEARERLRGQDERD